jgi:hypothetical protein
MSEETAKSEWRVKVLTVTRTVTKELDGIVVIRVLAEGDQDFDGDTPEGEALVNRLDEHDLIKWNENSEWQNVSDELSIIDVDEGDAETLKDWACDCRLSDDGEWEMD